VAAAGVLLMTALFTSTTDEGAFSAAWLLRIMYIM
jgi:hypothetical protein